MNKNTLPVSITLVLLLLFSGCQDPITPLGKAGKTAPAGKGYFLLRINGAESSRTIMPVIPDVETLYYKLEFFVPSETTASKTIGPVSYTDLDKVLLDAGTWNLTVSAYNDSTGTKMTAQEKITGIEITGGQTTPCTIQLKPIPIATGTGQGTFRWDIGYPDDVSSASMTIKKTSGGNGNTYYFTGNSTITSTSFSVSLDSGYYLVTFNLTRNDGKTLERREILHIYQNLESYYEHEFKISNFFAQMIGITVDPGSKKIYTLGESLDISVYAVYDHDDPSLILEDDWTSDYDAATAGTRTITITYRNNAGFTATFNVTVLGYAARRGTKEYPTLYAAITDIDLPNGSATNPTEIVILRDITAPEAGTTMIGGYTIPNNKNIKLTVEAGKNITITASAGNFPLFSVSNTGSSLTLEGNGTETLTLDGGKAAAALNRRGVNVGNGRSFTMNNGVIISGFNNSADLGSGGGVYNSGTFTMSGGKISGNNAVSDSGLGGGVCNNGTFTMSGGEISGNNAVSDSGLGGGVYNIGTFTMSGGEISGNTATGSGGGVLSGGVFTMSGGKISENKSIGNYRYGGGVTLYGGTFTMSGGEIMNNTAAYRGGGVYMSGNDIIFTMSGGTIYGVDDTNEPSRANIANGSTTPNGAAIFIVGGTAKYSGDYAGKDYGSGDSGDDITTTDETLPPKPPSITSPIIGIKLVPIPAGTFMMGSPVTEPNRNGDDTQHSVTLTKSFYMSKCLVTQKQYQAVMGAGEDRTTATYGKGDNYPIYNVNWYDALVFCNKSSMMEELEPVYSIGGSTDPKDWGSIPTSSDAIWNAAVMDTSKNGYRLPTEAEWEYACRGSYENKTTETNTKPFGIGDGTKMISGMANFYVTYPYNLNHSPAGEYNDSSATGWYVGKTTEVGSYEPNNYGLYDMHGNLNEWCWDWYKEYITTDNTDPEGAVGSNRVIRGGNWYGNGQYLRSAFRNNYYPSYRVGNGIGFRLVRTIQ